MIQKITAHRTVNSLEAIDSLRVDLHNLVSWSVDWQMLFNVDRCKVMHLVHYATHGTSQLQAATEERDLGVMVSEDLKWENQCIALVKKGNKLLGMIKRNFALTDLKKRLWRYIKVLSDHI